MFDVHSSGKCLQFEKVGVEFVSFVHALFIYGGKLK